MRGTCAAVGAVLVVLAVGLWATGPGADEADYRPVLVVPVVALALLTLATAAAPARALGSPLLLLLAAVLALCLAAGATVALVAAALLPAVVLGLLALACTAFLLTPGPHPPPDGPAG